MASGLNSQYKQYQKKRFIALTFIAFITFSIAIFAFITLYYFPTFQLLQSILLLVLIIFLTFILFIRQYMMTISMYLHYYRMVEENNPVLKSKILPYSEAFYSTLLQQGFVVGVKKNSYTIFYKYVEKLPFVQRTGPTLLVVIQTYLPGLSVHHEGIDQELSYIKATLQPKKPIQNELTLIVKKMERFETSNKEELEHIINFSWMNRAFITLQLAQFDNQTLYMLRPKKLYPNKYYYALVQLIYDLIKIEEKQR
jgi:hypothetical protein